MCSHHAITLNSTPAVWYKKELQFTEAFIRFVCVYLYNCNYCFLQMAERWNSGTWKAEQLCDPFGDMMKMPSRLSR